MCNTQELIQIIKNNFDIFDADEFATQDLIQNKEFLRIGNTDKFTNYSTATHLSNLSELNENSLISFYISDEEEYYVNHWTFEKIFDLLYISSKNKSIGPLKLWKKNVNFKQI